MTFDKQAPRQTTSPTNQYQSDTERNRKRMQQCDGRTESLAVESTACFLVVSRCSLFSTPPLRPDREGPIDRFQTRNRLFRPLFDPKQRIVHPKIRPTPTAHSLKYSVDGRRTPSVLCARAHSKPVHADAQINLFGLWPASSAPDPESYDYEKPKYVL